MNDTTNSLNKITEKLFSETKENPQLIQRALKMTFDESKEKNKSFTIEDVKQKIIELKKDW